ncbi:hypothetical protein EDC04DRAFT_2677062, partial [Pisolithus marmoratus]
IIQATLMTRVLRQPRMKKYLLGTQTSLYMYVAVFVILLLESEEQSCFSTTYVISNNIPVWNSFKETIAQRPCDTEGEGSLRFPSLQGKPRWIQ